MTTPTPGERIKKQDDGLISRKRTEVVFDVIRNELSPVPASECDETLEIQFEGKVRAR